MIGRRVARKQIIVGLISLALIGVAGLYTWSSIASWRSYESRLLDEQQAYESLKDQALQGKTPTSRLEAVQKLDDKLERRNELCTVNPLYGWQSWLIPALKDGVKKCTDKVKQLNAVAKPLSVLRDYLEAEAKIREIMSSLASDVAFSENNWKERGLQRVTLAKKALNDLRASTESDELRNQALGLVTATEKAWQALIAASDAKDKAAYLAASEQVIKSYAEFSALADTSDDILQKQVQAVTAAAAKM